MQVQAGGPIPPHLPRRAVCGLSAVAHALMQAPETLDAVIQRVAPDAALDPTLLTRAARRTLAQLDGRATES